MARSGGALNVPTLNASTTNYGYLTATNASSTNLTNFGTAYFGATAILTFDPAGDLTVAGNTTLGNATSTTLFATLGNFTSGVFNSLTTSIANITGLTATNATTTTLYASSAVVPTLTATWANISDATSTNFFASNLSGNVSDATVVANGSTAARTLAARWADVINLKDFGAKCDGVTDDTVAIQNFLAALGPQEAGFIPPGNLHIHEPVIVPRKKTT